ncbi:hypothetical protein HNY73_003405 [Argiope bruennichi]|uniref:Uncharacterized protein n=1 Tax=Argiope bruennichi TaxID=94029 RepID=A0A8T0FSP0_ARGBR|nr:hypothetical protein HNY73_003405 [Argiope bruennichi]
MPDRSDYNVNKNTIMATIQEKDPSIRVRGIGQLQGGGVKIITSNTESAKYVNNILKNTDGIENTYEILTPDKRSPQIILYNVSKDIVTEELTKGLIEKNLFLCNPNNTPNFKINFKIPAKDREKYHWVITVPPRIFREIREKGGLYFGWERLRVAEFIGIKQCKICMGYGHTSKTYINPNEKRCDRCGNVKIEGERHHCQGLRCINCIKHNQRFGTSFGTGHSCLDRRCKSYLKQKDIIRSRTDYGQ